VGICSCVCVCVVHVAYACVSVRVHVFVNGIHSTNPCTQRNIHTHTNIVLLSHMLTRSSTPHNAHVHELTRSHTQTGLCPHTNKRMQTHTHTHIHTHTHTHIQAHTHTHSYTRTHAHTHTHTYTYTGNLSRKLFSKLIDTLF